MSGSSFTRRMLLIAAAFAVATGLAKAQTYEGRELVRAELVADTTAITPGKPFAVGVWLHQAPGWHTYWQFPGDAGIPTEVKWKLPAGWTAGAIQWPIPLKLREPGDIQIYGYHDDVLLMQEITPPKSIEDSNIDLSAQVDWLVCDKICIPGGAKLTLSVPVNHGVAQPANAEMFSRFRRSLPQALPASNVADVSWSRVGSELQLKVKSRALSNYPFVDFYPVPDSKVVVGHTQKEARGGEIVFRIPIETSDSKVSALDGLLVFGQTENGADLNAWTINRDAARTSREVEVAPRFAEIAKFLLFGMIGGFILNLMPCVLPVISLKIFGFIQHAGQSRRRILRSGLAFAAGIFAWFIGLALLLIALRSAGRELTWAFQFTNPIFVVAMSAVVLVFALNLFGVFEIGLPQFASRGVLGWTAKEGDAGSFFQGVFATVLATPCTAPFLGTALGFAFTQSALLILAMFLAIAAGMSLPYILLSAQPAWLRLLPKPGVWMVKVKQLMGFLLLATLLFLLWVVAAERGAEAVIWTACFLLALSLACWLKGAFITAIASAAQRFFVLVLMLMLVLGSGVYFIGNKFAAARLPNGSVELTDGWQPFTPARLADELAQNHGVFVDFTATWCVTCKFNEATVLESAAVREAFTRRAITKLKADWTNADPEITKILKQFGRPGVPFYVYYPAGKSAQPIVFPELLTKGIILDKLENPTPSIAAQ